jgi:hypothetical protein
VKIISFYFSFFFPFLVIAFVSQREKGAEMMLVYLASVVFSHLTGGLESRSFSFSFGTTNGNQFRPSLALSLSLCSSRPSFQIRLESYQPPPHPPSFAQQHDHQTTKGARALGKMRIHFMDR